MQIIQKYKNTHRPQANKNLFIINCVITFCTLLNKIQNTMTYNNFYQRPGQVIKSVSHTDDYITFWFYRNSTLIGYPNTMEYIGYNYNATSKLSYINSISRTFNQSYRYTEEKFGEEVVGLSCYVFKGLDGRVCCKQSNSTLSCSTWDYSLTHNSLQVTFGNTAHDLYKTLQVNNSFDFKKCAWMNNTTSQNCSILYQFSGEQAVDINVNHGLIFLLSYNLTNTNQVYVRILTESSGSLGLMKLLTFSFLSVANLGIRMSRAYLVVFSGTQISINFMYQNFFPTMNYTTSSPILDIACALQNLYIATSSKIDQYTYASFINVFTQMYSGIANGALQLDQKHQVIVTFRTTDLSGTYVDIFGYSGGYYIYNAPFVCDPFYYDLVQGHCLFNQTEINLVNLSALYNVTALNQIAINTQNSNFTTSIASLAIISAPSKCRISKNGFCTQLCAYECEFCQPETGACTSCRTNYEFDELGRCVLPISTKFAAFAYALLNTFRFQNAQQLYFFTDYLNLYNYHRTNYTGIFEYSISYINAMQDNLWNFFPVDEIYRWFHQPLSLHNYNEYTNAKFLLVENSDCFFLQNVRSYVLVYMPLSLLAFYITNKIFNQIHTLKISCYIRVYAFYLYLGVICIVQNSQSLTLYSYNYLISLMSFDYKLKFINFLSVGFIGFVFLINITIFPFSYYLYNKLYKYFLSNCFSFSYSLIYTYFRFTIFPLFQSLIHCVLYNYPKHQLIILSIGQLIAIIILMFFQISPQIAQGYKNVQNQKQSQLLKQTQQEEFVIQKTKIIKQKQDNLYDNHTYKESKRKKNISLFVNKIIFWNEVILHFFVIALNFMLYLGHQVPQIAQNYDEIIQPCMKIWTIIFLCIYFISIGYVPLRYFITKIILKIQRSMIQKLDINQNKQLEIKNSIALKTNPSQNKNKISKLQQKLELNNIKIKTQKLNENTKDKINTAFKINVLKQNNQDDEHLQNNHDVCERIVNHDEDRVSSFNALTSNL